MNNLSMLTTEKRNERSASIDNQSTIDILTIINNEDRKVADAVQKVLPEVEKVVDAVCRSIKNGGRLFYVGAGTSGRIGILDAVECPPTYSTPPELVQGIIAGGNKAIEKAVEGAEDDKGLGAESLRKRNLTDLDVVIGIAASGRTPFVAGALEYAREIGARTVSLSNNENSIISRHADIRLEVVTGPEVITGSTRMKAATAQKMILNMITTASMIKVGKVYENLMVDVKVSNQKLKERANSIVCTVTGVPYENADSVLAVTDYEVKPAIVMIKAGVPLEKARELLAEADGYVRKAIDIHFNEGS
jgi:N-acetylmuramic acid 6-phosphate etherase